MFKTTIEEDIKNGTVNMELLEKIKAESSCKVKVEDDCAKEKTDSPSRKERNLSNSDTNTTKSNTSDAVFFGNSDSFKLLCKFSSKQQGVMKSTKACFIPGSGCIVQSTTERIDYQGRVSVAEASVFVPNCHIVEDTDPDGNVIGRHLEGNDYQDPRCVGQA